jgi:hypothetical protein
VLDRFFVYFDGFFKTRNETTEGHFRDDFVSASQMAAGGVLTIDSEFFLEATNAWEFT